MKTAGKKQNVLSLSPGRLSAYGCLFFALIPGLPAGPVFANSSATSLPTDGVVSSGNAIITSRDAVMNVSQSTNSAIINWSTFNVGAQAQVNFRQPDASSKTLNRVIGSDPSQISGKITANGHIYLINPHGIVFNEGSQISATGIVASTLELTDQAFQSGSNEFQRTAASGSVVNEGAIIAPAEGYVALLGVHVSNKGTISAGKAILAAGDKIEIPLTESGLVSIEAALNDGSVSSDGSGTINARDIQIVASGVLNVKGASIIDASSAIAKGGAVTLKGKEIRIEDNARLKANGKTGGGRISIGDKKITETVQIGSNATIEASATKVGTGGEVVIWSRNSTSVAGSIFAQGGAEGGDGGFVETSSTGSVRILSSAKVNTIAFRGKTGTWLLDPAYYTIAASGGDETGDSVEASLAISNRTIAADHTIYVNDSLDWSANTLTLTAGVDIDINAVMSATGTATLVLTATSGNVLTGALGKVNLADGTALSINGQAYTIINSLGAEGSVSGNDLQGIAGNLTGYYALGSDIDASATSAWNTGAGFTPIGADTPGFTGIFNGLGHVVRNLYINAPAATNVGLFGYTGSSKVSNVGVVNATVTGANRSGILIGMSYSTVLNSFSSGSISGATVIGGLVGYIGGGSVSTSHSSANVNGTGNYVGGLVGRSNYDIDRSFATGTVFSAGDYVGGLVGRIFGSLSQSYAIGNVQSTSSYVGGLVGYNAGSVSDSFATGKVTGGTNKGGLIGYNGGTSSNSYWNTTTSGLVTSSGGSGLTTAQMMAQSSFSGWNFSSVWAIAEGAVFPYLRWQGTPNFITAGGDLSSGQTIRVAVNGEILGSGSTAADGSVYIILPQGSFGVGDNLLLWNVGGSSNAANAVYIAGSSIASGASLNVSALWGNSANGLLSSSALIAAKGDLVSDDIRYTVSGTDITLLNATTLTNTSTGGINIDTVLNWSANTLTISPTTGDININAVMNATGTAALVMSTSGEIKANLTASGFTGKVNLAAGTALTVNGHPYTIINSLGAEGSTTGTDLQGIAGNLNGYYALGSDIDASPTSSWASGAGFNPIASFSGIFNGLGHTVSQLSVIRPASSSSALFASTGTSAVVQNTGIVSASISGISYVGALVARNYGVVLNSYSAGTIAGSDSWAGGLVGMNMGTTSLISQSFSSATVNGATFVGGLLGRNDGTVSESSASGSADGSSNVGGLVGSNGVAVIANSYASSTVTGNAYTGGLVGRNWGQIESSYATGTVDTDGAYTGGLVGDNGADASILSSYSTSSVTSTAGTVGGLVGINYGGITDSHATGEVEGTSDVGGLAGYNYSGNGVISGSYATGHVIGGALSVGGLVGRNYGLIEFSHATGAVDNAANSYTGGLVGRNYGTVTDSYASGDVSGAIQVGGLVGYNCDSSVVQRSFATGNVSGSEGVGGLVGRNYYGSIANSYATGATTNTGNYTGALVGFNSGAPVTNSFAIGYVNGSSYSGGLIGYSASGTITSSYWNTESTGKATSSGGTSLTSAQMRASANFSGWDFSSTWNISAGASYPYLQHQGTPTIISASGNLSVGEMVRIVLNGSVIGQHAVAGAGNLYAVLPQGTVSAGDILLLYNLNGSTSAANAVYVAGNSFATGLSLSSSTLWAGSGYGALNSSSLIAAKGDVVSDDIRYTVSGTDITLLNATTLTNTSTGGINIDTVLNWSANTLTISPSTGDININAVMNATGTAALVMTTPGEIIANLTASGFTGKVNLASGTSLTINGHAYTIINSLGAAGSTTGTDLQGINGNKSGYFALGSDIDASATSSWNSNAGFTPIGTSGAFTGTFNGLGHTVTGLVVNRSSWDNVGLFGVAGSTSAIINVGLTSATITGHNQAGGLVGSGSGTVKRSYASATVSGYCSLGALIGTSTGTVRDSYSSGSVSGTGWTIGGLVGGLGSAGLIEDSYSSANIGGSGWTVGGLVGSSSGTINNTYAEGTVASGGVAAGGLVGQNSGSVTNSYATGTINAGSYNAESDAGGLVGNNSGTISSSYSTSTVNGANYLGGLVGDATSTSVITNSHATGNVSGSYYIGGLVGRNEGAIEGAYYGSGSITGSNTYIGGLTGSNSGTISGSHTAGVVLGYSYVGGLSGSNSGTIEESYATGTAQGTNWVVGGLTASNSGTIRASYATGSVTSAGMYTGGLVGDNSGAISDSHATGNVSGGNYNSESDAGGLVGLNQNSGSITSSYATGNVNGAGCVGGLVGHNKTSATVSLSYATGIVTASKNAGGLVGQNWSTISESYSTGSVTGTGNGVGGFVGINSGTISGSHAAGSAQAYTNVGGFAGVNSGTLSEDYATGYTRGTGYTVGGLVGSNTGSIISSHANGDVRSTYQYTGGLVGENYGPISNSYATGSITAGNYNAQSWAGGLVGLNENSIASSFATGFVSGAGYLGGLVGVNRGSGNVSNSYATGTVSGSYNIAGLVGANSSTISNSFSISRVVATGTTGGLVAANSGTVTNSYWNTETSGKSTSAGGTGRTTSAMKAQSNFVDWNFTSTWAIAEGISYPYLQSQGQPSIITATSNLAAGQTIRAVVNGSIVGTTWTAADKSVYFILPQGTFSAGSNLLVYQVGGSTNAANAIYVAGSRIAPGLSLTAGTLWVNSGYGALPTSALATAVGSLVSEDVRYTVSGGEITLLNATTITNTSTGDITVDIPLNWSANTLTLTPSTGDININADLNATGTAALVMTTTGNINIPLTSSGFTAQVNLASGTSLTINGHAYTIINSVGAAGSTTGTDLQGINGNLTGYYALGSDIDASATATWNYYSTGDYYYGFAPIGSSSSVAFGGVFDGLGHTVSGLYINRPSTSNVGLFGYTTTSALHKNVGVESATVTGSSSVGALVGHNDNPISNVYTLGTVTGGAGSVGGIAGYSGSAVLIFNSYSGVAVTANATAGGLVGANYGSILDSYATGTVAVTTSNVGGLVGVNNAGASISDSYSTGNVSSGDLYAGGLVGQNFAEIVDSHATGDINAGNQYGYSYAGGLAGASSASGSITNSYATGAVTATGTYVGGLVGYNYESSSIASSYATGPTSGTRYVGGLVGYNTNSIAGSYASGLITVTSTGYYGGGLVGYNLGGTVSDSYATGNVTGNLGNLGGFSAYNTGLIERCYALGDVSGSGNNVGGFLGTNSGTATDSYATGAVHGVMYSGGFVGRNTGSILRSYAMGNVSGGSSSGYSYAGGLAGANDAGGVISLSYSTGDVAGTGSHVGGLVGHNLGSSTISNSYSISSASGTSYVGGLVGNNASEIITSYSAGRVSAGGSNVGGFTGANTGTVTNGYWNTATSGKATSLGGTALTTAQMKAQASFAGWDFASVWSIAEGASYPYLQSQGTPGIITATGNLSSGQTIRVAVNGDIIGSGLVAADGSVYVVLPQGTFSAGDSLLLYNLNGSTTAANAVYAAGSNVASGLSLTSSALWAGSGNGALHSSALIAAKGSLSSDDIRYTISGTEIALLNATTFTNASTGGVVIDNVIHWNANTFTISPATGNININADLNATGTAGLVMTTSGEINLPLTSSGFTASVNLASGTSLTINGHAYTIINSLGAAGSTTGTDLQGINGNLSGYYALGSDIDASATSSWNSNAGFGPLGSPGMQFSGAFNGLGHTITGLRVNYPSSNYVGFFGTINSSASIRSVGLENASITGAVNVGGLSGLSYGTVDQVYLTGAVNGTVRVGGLVGFSETGASLSDSFVDATITATSDAGGLIGLLNGGSTLSNSSSEGAVTISANTGDSYAGGLVGENNGTISNSHSEADVSNSGTFTGGIAGDNHGTITTSYATGTVSGVQASGGLAGINYGTISASYETGATTGTNHVGGVAGVNYGSITASHAEGTVNGSWSVGGVAGTNSGTISTSYATGAISGASSVGGLVGYHWGNITDSYATGTVSGSSQVGGLAGYLNSDGRISDSYATGNVTISATGDTYAGGLVGENSGTITDSHAEGNVSNGGNFTGGITGDNHGTITNSYATGTISGTNTVGGVAGINYGTIGSSYKTGSTSGSNSVGGLAGVNYGSVTESHAEGTVSGSSSVGGVAGTSGGTISLSYASATVSGTSSVGGLVGYHWGNITDSYATGTASGSSQVGGLAGYLNSDGRISGSYATGNVTISTNTGDSYAGGLVGENNGVITNSHAEGNLSNSGNFSGGITGDNHGTITNSYATGSVSGLSTVGGLAGINYGTIGTAYATGQASGTNYVGGLIGVNYGGVTGSHAEGAVSGSYCVGGFAGVNGGSIGTSYATGTVSGSSRVGGLIGNHWGTATSSYATGAVSGSVDVGGLAGYVTSDGRITGSFAAGNVTIDANTGESYAGGLVGENYGIITDSHAEGDVTNSGMFTGGLVAANHNTITNSYATGPVAGVQKTGGLVGINYGTIGTAYATGGTTGTSYVGGFAGINYGGISASYATGSVGGTGTQIGGLVGTNGGSIGSSYAAGTVSGSTVVGGLIGSHSGSVTNGYATGNVSGTSTVGGLIGYSAGSVSNTYSSGLVQGTSDRGGLVGSSTVAATNSYWDKITSGTLTSSTGTGLTTTEMKAFLTYSSVWSISQSGTTTPSGSTVWVIYNGQTYPLLKTFMTSLAVTASNGTKVYDATAYTAAAATFSPIDYDAGKVSGTLAYAGSFSGATSSGAYVITPTGLYSSQHGYDITYVSGTLTISPAEIAITAENQAKVYGTAGSLGTTAFTVSGTLYGSDSISGVTLSSAGVDATATVGTHSITASNGVGDGLANYSISYQTGELSVTPASLTITARNQTKTYGTTLNLGPTAFDAVGLVGSDSISSVTLSSPGSEPLAIVGSYSIAASGPGGQGLGNYLITYVDGTLTVTPSSSSGQNILAAFVSAPIRGISGKVEFICASCANEGITIIGGFADAPSAQLVFPAPSFELCGG
jgi:filamentous hemagglutinin family protein